jgi:enoyl-CoA hydratase/carnithine racemase
VSETSPVRVERRGSMAVLTLNRPEERNPLDRATSLALLEAMVEAFTDDDVRSVAITGSGGSFCAGGDLRQMQRFSTTPIEESFSWPQAIVDLHRAMLDAPKPVVAAVDGPALAGGMGLAGMCDVIVATTRATFGTPEVKLGLFPMIIVAHLARAVPRKIFLEMVLTGDPIDAAEAYRIGFANRLCEPQELDQVLSDYAHRFEKSSPQALRLGRKAFTLLSELPAEQALQAAQFFNLPFFHGSDLAEGVDAFFDKRRPSWIPNGEQ